MRRFYLKVINIICLLSLFPSFVLAYDYVDPSNQSDVEAARRDIYSLKKMYEELAGEPDASSVSYESAVNNLYWWPIGSTETTTSDGKEFATGTPEDTVITSTYGYRSLNGFHNAIDIANYTGEGKTNIIAAKDGIVVYPISDAATNCPTGGFGNTCGGGYGNYVIIQHADGNYTLYAHMYENSIPVKAGDNVKQGQVIGKMGNSGSSTGTHLHFEIREGVNNGSNAVDPLNYVSQENPRPSSTSSTLVDYINYFEGVGCSGQQSIDGDNYVACVGSDGVTTIGHGVVWEYNKEIFAKYGYSSVTSGTRVPIEVVDAIQAELIENAFGNPVRNALADAGIDNLKDYQINALISRAYNAGLYSVAPGTSYSFIPAYLKHNGSYRLDEFYGSINGIWSDSMSVPVTDGYGNLYPGLQRRRASEWIWFTTGEVNFLESNFNAGQYSW